MSAPEHHPLCFKDGCLGVDAGCSRAAYERGRNDEAADLAWCLQNKAPVVMSDLMACKVAVGRSKRTSAARNRQKRARP